MSAITYVALLLLVLSIPVIFIYQAFQGPVFELDSVSVQADFSGDENIPAESAEGWQKIEFSLIADGGRFSPYSFSIDEFSVMGDYDADKIRLTLDEPIFCTKDTRDPFVLTVYVKDAGDINEFIKSVSFKASDYEKSFGEFSLKFVDGRAKIFG